MSVTPETSLKKKVETKNRTRESLERMRAH